jgi:putative zinc finger protein
MNCGRVDLLLSDHLEGLLSSRQARAMTAHLAGCSHCRWRREQLRAVGAELRCIEALCRPPDLLDCTLEQWLTTREIACSPRPAGFPGLQSGSAFRIAYFVSGKVGIRNTQYEMQSGRHHRGTGVCWRAAVVAAAALAGAAAIALLLWGPLGARGPSANTAVTSSTRGAHGSRIAQGFPSASWRQDPRPPADPRSRAGGGDQAGVQSPVRFAGNLTSGPEADERLHSGNRPGGRVMAGISTACPVDDLASLNDDAPRKGRQWMPLRPDAWDEIEARVRQNVRVKDDFITIPFPRLASTAARQIAEAAESYQRQAAIVDARLVREVTCAFKATALSVLCDRLRAETGIQLTAGPSVADEKVTLFCEKLPLREVMRQLLALLATPGCAARRKAGSIATSWCRTCGANCWRRSCATATGTPR